MTKKLSTIMKLIYDIKPPHIFKQQQLKAEAKYLLAGALNQDEDLSKIAQRIIDLQTKGTVFAWNERDYKILREFMAT